MNLEQRYDSRLEERKASGLFRELPDAPIAGVDFTHNDYLGLSQHPRLVEAAISAANEFGLGGQASRLLGARAEMARQLETDIAAAKSENGQALVYSTGFQLNASVISTLLKPDLLGAKPNVFADRLIHASLHTGIRMAGARQSRFKHNDLDHLERLLEKKAEPGSPNFVFVESIYGMDGDRVDLDRLYRLKAKHDFFLYVDEAHSIGVEGPQGYGLARQTAEQADVVIGTFSKALGAAGGFVVASETIKNLLVNFCNGLIYSTAPSPVVLAAVAEAWRLLPELSGEREKLNQLGNFLRHQLTEHGWDFGESESHIVPILIGAPERAMNLKSRLAAAGLNVACIRPPTVPTGTSRLRVSLSVRHTQDQVAQIVKVISA